MKLRSRNISVSNLKKARVPLSPLPEQHRIVAKVNELMSLCDQLESQLNTSPNPTPAISWIPFSSRRSAWRQRARGETPAVEHCLAEPSSGWWLVERNPRTVCILPVDFGTLTA